MFSLIQVASAGLSRGSNYHADLDLASITPSLSSLGLKLLRVPVFSSLQQNNAVLFMLQGSCED